MAKKETLHLVMSPTFQGEEFRRTIFGDKGERKDTLSFSKLTPTELDWQLVTDHLIDDIGNSLFLCEKRKQEDKTVKWVVDHEGTKQAVLEIAQAKLDLDPPDHLLPHQQRIYQHWLDEQNANGAAEAAPPITSEELAKLESELQAAEEDIEILEAQPDSEQKKKALTSARRKATRLRNKLGKHSESDSE